MPEAQGPVDPRAEPTFLRRAFLVSAAVFPLWHLAAPADATDPWWAWWLVAGSFWAVGLASLRVPWVERHLLGCFHTCSALVTLQLYLLAFANDMHPFYAVGSAMAVLATVLFIRSGGTCCCTAASSGCWARPSTCWSRRAASWRTGVAS